MPEVLLWIGGVLALLLVLWALFRKTPVRDPEDRPVAKGYGVALGNAMAEFEAVLNPAAEHRLAEERSQAAMGEVVPTSEPDHDEEE